MTVEAILLGTTQDGGLPQAGCHCVRCTQARTEPGERRWVACLGLIDHTARQTWLIDATPDLKEQLHALQELVPGYPLSGIVLTHAHIGHYAGLIHLGREAWNTRALPVYASARMAQFLRANAPWSQLVDLENIDLRQFRHGQEIQLSPRLHLTPLPVPHRDEFSDTVAFVARGVSRDTAPGAARRLFYCPDIDAWDRWDQDLRQFVSGMDIALLDGTFFSAHELPGRDLSQIPHPLAIDTTERLAGVDCEVHLIHLNHTNPLLARGPESRWLAERGLSVGAFGARWRLDGQSPGGRSP
jgi:pyrroloquinoline quinone biosynthesis protein B